jgi:hypothetical protein
MKLPNKTYLIRAQGITAVWFKENVLSAWWTENGESCNLWLAYASTENAQPSTAAAPIEPACTHGLPPHLCMVCPQSNKGDLA